MKSRITTTFCVVAAIALFGALPFSLAGNGHSRKHSKSNSPTKKITIRVSSELDQLHLVDQPPSGMSVGDVLIFTEKLSNAEGAVVGHDAATCTRLFDERSLCTGNYTFRRGEIMVQLTQPGLTGSLSYDQAIVGGTGRFAGASGTVTVHQSPSGDRFLFRVTVPRKAHRKKRKR